MANYDAWLAALSNDDDEEKAQKQLNELRARNISPLNRSPEGPDKDSRKVVRRYSLAPAMHQQPVEPRHTVNGPLNSRRSVRRHSLAPNLRRPQPPGRASFKRRVQHNQVRAQANWSKLRSLWRKRGHELAVWGRNYKGCFVEGAKFEWTSREVGKEVEWLQVEESTHEHIENLLARRDALLDSLRLAQEPSRQKERVEIGDAQGTPRTLDRGRTIPSHLSMTFKRTVQTEQALVNPAELERRIASVDQTLRTAIKRESRLQAVTQRTEPPRRPTVVDLQRATQSARTASAVGDAPTDGTVLEQSDRQKERATRSTIMHLMQGSSRVQDISTKSSAVESTAQMTIDSIVKCTYGHKSPMGTKGVPPCVCFTATIEYPRYNNVVQARGTVCRHELKITEHSATRPWCCLAQLPNTYTVDLRQADQLFYGAWPPHAEVDWRTGLTLPLPSRPPYLIQRYRAQSMSGQEIDSGCKGFIGTYGCRSAANDEMPEGTIKRFARVMDWDLGPTETVGAKKYFTPRIKKRLACAKKRHNDRLAQTHKWIGVQSAELERQNAIAQAATDEGTKMFLKFHAKLRHTRRTNQELEEREHEERQQRMAHSGENWGVAVREHHTAAKRRSSSGKAAQVRRVMAQQNVTESANKTTAARMQ